MLPPRCNKPPCMKVDVNKLSSGNAGQFSTPISGMPVLIALISPVTQPGTVPQLKYILIVSG